MLIKSLILRSASKVSLFVSQQNDLLFPVIYNSFEETVFFFLLLCNKIYNKEKTTDSLNGETRRQEKKMIEKKPIL